MHAALITGHRRVELVDFDDPQPAPGGVVVDISLCGVCGTDVHAFVSGEPYHPALCGHEWAGHLSAVGADVRDLSEGDRVVVAVPPACGRCRTCEAGHTEHCEETFLHQLGHDRLAPPHGGFAPRVAVGRGRVVRADDRLDDVQAAQIEPATVTLHAVRRSGLRLGDLAVVQGAGPIGLTTLQWVRAAGAGEVVVIEPSEGRRALAVELGATVAVAPGDAEEAVAERSGGLGADAVYECVGAAATVQRAVDLARRGGRVCLIGLAHGEVPIDPRVWLVKEITVTAALAYLHEEFELAMSAVADGRVRLTPMHTDTVGLDGLGEALSRIADGDPAVAKVLVDPRA